MEKKEVNILSVFGALAFFLFLNMNCYRPTYKNHKELEKEYKEIKERYEKFSKAGHIEDKLITRLDNRVKELQEIFSHIIPDKENPPDRFKILPNVPEDIKLSFTNILPLVSYKEKNYIVYPLRVKINTSFPDFIKYLDWLRSQDLLISIENLRMRRSSLKNDILNIEAIFSSYSMGKNISEVEEIIKMGKLSLSPRLLNKFVTFLDKRKGFQKKKVSLVERGFDPFSLEKFRPQISSPEEKILPSPLKSVSTLSLEGIAKRGDNKIAFINGKIVKEGDVVEGFKVLEIKKFKVIVSDGRNRYELEIK